MASPWTKTQKHADWSEQVDEELAQNGGTLSPPAQNTLDEEAFPSLGEAAKVKQPKKKRGGQKMSLGEFVGNGARPGRGTMSDREIVMNLPTAPRERGPDDDGGWTRGEGWRGSKGIHASWGRLDPERDTGDELYLRVRRLPLVGPR